MGLVTPVLDEGLGNTSWLVDLGDGRYAVRQCHQIGYDRLAGELGGGMAASRAAGLPVAVTPRPAPGALGSARVLDVRQDDEHALGHLPRALHVELGALPAAADRLGDVDAVMCVHGERASTGASVLERAGRPGVAAIAGGPDDWVAATGRPLATT